jgi:hypothetical protein
MSGADTPTKQKLWGGRFTGKTDPLMHAFNQSLSYDKRMYSADIRGSIAYAKSLALVGLLTEEEKDKIVDGLMRVGEEWKNGTVCFFDFYRWSPFRGVGLTRFHSSKSSPMMRISILPTNGD